MKVSSTKEHSANRLKVLVYGAPGVGKTTLAGTLKDKVLVISAEAGLLSLSDRSIDVIDITVDDKGQSIPKEHRVKRLGEVMAWVSQKEQTDKYQWLFIDSLTEITQNLIENLYKVYPDAKDAIKMWGEYSKKARSLVKMFRDLPTYNVVFTALDAEDKDENNRRYIKVDVQGKIGKQLPAFFDEVFWLHIDKADDKRKLLTAVRENVSGKDRSGKLDALEPPDLEKIVQKIRVGAKKNGNVSRARDKPVSEKAQSASKQNRTQSSTAKPSGPIPARAAISAQPRGARA